MERVAATHRTGLRLPTNLSFEGWSRIGRQMFVISDSSAWWWGDWLVFGERRYPDRYRRAITQTNLDYQTLRNYAWVARRFSTPRRRERLSFQHHVVVAALPEAEQDKLLAAAEEHGWSRNELRRQVRQRDQPSAAADRAVYHLSVDADRQQRWQQAAVRVNEQLTDWIVQCLDQAAAAALLEADDQARADRDARPEPSASAD